MVRDKGRPQQVVYYGTWEKTEWLELENRKNRKDHICDLGPRNSSLLHLCFIKQGSRNIFITKSTYLKMKTQNLGFVSSCNIHIQMKNSDLRLRKNCYSLEPGSNLKIIVQHKTAKIQILIPVIVSSTEIGPITMSPIHTLWWLKRTDIKKEESKV